MTKIVFRKSCGTRVEVDSQPGETVMLAAMLGDIAEITADCGGGCSCGTCRVEVDPAWLDRAGECSALEQEMIEAFGDATERTRLSCQLIITDELDGLTVDVPG